MSEKTSRTAGEAVQRLNRQDETLESIDLNDAQLTSAQLERLVDALLAQPNIVRRVYLGANRLSDALGAKLARYLAASSTVQRLGLSCNAFSEATYLAVAWALRVNSSLRILYLHRNRADPADVWRIDAAFTAALQLNPDRPPDSYWCLYEMQANDYHRLRHTAQLLGHPSLQLLAQNWC